ncbi:MAG: glucosaminidase domain-containing protein [Sulfurovaceae bacterium]|nr:glucosaminidase domain-containing protein [Sulfurovaceae bacterium]
MNKQKSIIKILLYIIFLQSFLFVIYYIYINFIQINYNHQIIPHSHIVLDDIDNYLPYSSKFDKIEEPKFIHQKLVKNIKRITPQSTEDIISIDNKFVQPILYTKSIPLSKLSIPEKKQKFIDMMIPSILVAKQQLKYQQKKVAKLILQKDISYKDQEWLDKKRKEFQAIDNYELYNKMETHPTSIIIAQAIIESGWGTSKFFQKANNVFGIWSFNSKEERLSASKKRGKKIIYLRKYKNIEESIYDYLLTLSKKDAYKEFREKRLKIKDPYKLADYLTKYSEEREKYTRRVKNMIKQNKLARYDKYRLDL